jgi:peptide/nickel transport system ATP-binding protein
VLLDVRNLRTYYGDQNAPVRAVDGISFQVEKGRNLGVVGESGCGKTTAAKSINRILSGSGRIAGGEIIFKGRDLVKLSEEDLNTVRWREISLVTQSAMNALDPVYPVGQQIMEAIDTHRPTSRRKAVARVEELFGLVGLEKNRLWDYPHQLSGGMKQRVVIAMAMALEPDLIIADEPTTALDVVVQDGILKQLELLQQRLHMAMILVTHDIFVVAETCQNLAVMYAGKIMEYGPTAAVLHHPHHPYTMGLQNAFPTLKGAAGDLISIPGSLPNLAEVHRGCLFAERCPFARAVCFEEPPGLNPVRAGHQVACHFHARAVEFREKARDPETWQQVSEKSGGDLISDDVLLETRALKKWYPVRRGFLATVSRRPAKHLKALDGVSFSLRKGEIMGLAGESGSGKSTLGELLTSLQTPSAGAVLFENADLTKLKGKTLKYFRRHVQMVFQDPYETLNPRFTIQSTVMEPLHNHRVGTYDERLALVKDALRRVELNPPEQYLLRFPHELSGGQRQRVAIARAIVLEPRLLIADEPVSMLDVSIRAGILNLFRRFRREMEMSIIYVSHDLATIRYICDRTAILYLGRMAEIGPTETVITRHLHPYTEMLISAVPFADPGEKRPRVDSRGEIPDPIDLPNGCRFHPRCPYVMDICGWEGRDILKVLENRKESIETADSAQAERALLKGITRMELQGTNLYIRVIEPEKMARYLKDTVVEPRALLKAMGNIRVDQGGVLIPFPRIDEPPYYRGETPDHLVACHRYR